MSQKEPIYQTTPLEKMHAKIYKDLLEMKYKFIEIDRKMAKIEKGLKKQAKFLQGISKIWN